MKAKRLGRGLSGLITRTDETAPPPRDPAHPPATAAAPEAAPEGVQLDPRAIRPNPYQPRVAFADDELDALEASIREHGILQPLVVRPIEGGYELVAGERRLRAARALGLAAVPVVLRRTTDEEMQALSLVENIQRVDLNAMEKARALKALMRNFGLTQEQVAERVGKARTTIANMVRLLDLPDVVQTMIEQGALTGAQGRAVLQAEGAERRVRLAEEARRRGLSVREIERRARRGPTVGKRRAAEPDPYVHDLEERLTKALSTKVALTVKGQAGTIRIAFANADELDRLLERLT